MFAATSRTCIQLADRLAFRNWGERMKRRDFLGTLIATGGAWVGNVSEFPSKGLFAKTLTAPADVKRVLTVFKCHFDAGFIDTQAVVVRRYFDDYYPQAIQIAAQLSHSGSPGYVWTTGSWLLYEYLEQATPQQRKTMEEAIRSGFIAWHALPFTWQTEMMDPSLISGAVALSRSLDKRFGYKTTGAKMTDVPGHTRGIVSPLAAQGVTFLEIGVNDASRPAILPPIFRWQDPAGSSLVVMYHPGYGGVATVPGSDFAIATVVKDDDEGPHTLEEIATAIATLKKQFPNAEIIPTNLSKISQEVVPFASSLPVVTKEVGDTWIHGIASDPLKVSRYREVCRLREKWIQQGKFYVGDETDLQLLRHLLLEIEHTWGTDTKTWLDFDNYIPRDLKRMLDTKNYQVVISSWQEKRRDLLQGIETLPGDLRTEATTAVSALNPPAPAPLKHIHPADRDVETADFLVKLDEHTGAIAKLHHKKSGRDWASPAHPLALFSYQTLSQQDYASFFKEYVVSEEDWAKKDFGKPNIERFGAVSQTWKPSLVQCESEESSTVHRILARLEIRDAQAIASGRAAFPKRVCVEYVLPKNKSTLEINLYWSGKEPSRMPEALWLSFNPITTDDKGWTLRKSGQEVSPFDVVDCGNRHMHAVSDRVSYKDAKGALSFLTLDAPLVALARLSPLFFTRSQPILSEGIHFNLFNNAWGTNYIMWFGEDMRFRFAIQG
jgi:hypothetical protein